MFMETTDVPAARSAAQIAEKLVSIGARRVSMMYDDERRIRGVDFTLVFGRLELPFSIPARIEALIANERFAPSSRDYERRREHAERVAWRQLFRWVEAQCAIIDTGMVTNIEVFTPYRCLTGEYGERRTLYEAMIENEMKMLPPANGGA
jgi:hypothetical protein